MLSDIENNSGLREFGYKPFAEKYEIDSMAERVRPLQPEDNDADNHIKEPLDVRPSSRLGRDDYRHPNEDYDHSDANYSHQKTHNQNKPIKDYGGLNQTYVQPKDNDRHQPTVDSNWRQPSEELNLKSDSSEEKTSKTVCFAPDFPKTSKPNGLHTYGVKDEEEKSDEKITKKYDKLLTRTPRLQDFGITRRFTLLPSVYHKPDLNGRSQQYSTPEEPSYSSSQTCRFNYMNNGFNMASNMDPITPPNPDLSHNNSQATDSFVTVEFTPGLTTKRPKGISRINNDHNRNQNNKNDHKRENYPNPKNDYNYRNQNQNQNRAKDWSEPTQSQRLPQSVLQSVDNNSEVTPEQPIPGADAAKSAQLLKSIGGNKGSGTPPMPKSRVDRNFHQQILNNL